MKLNLPTIEQMLEAGVHFGHQVKRRSPLMDKYVYGSDGKSQIIDVYKTREMLEKACEFLYETAKSGKQIVLVGTKRQAAQRVAELAEKSGALYVNQRWLGGTFTNFESIKGKIKELERLESGMKSNAFDSYTKKERLLIEREIEKLNETVGGIRGIEKFPGAMVVVDVKKEAVAVHEANQCKVPVVALVDTNSEPKGVNYVVPANDDAIKSIDILLTAMADAIEQGYADKKDSSAEAKKEEKPVVKAKKATVKK